MTSKTWSIVAIAVAVLAVGIALAVIFLRAPDRAADAYQASVGEVDEEETSIEQATEDLEAAPFDSAELMFTGSSALGEQPGFFERVNGVVYLDADGQPAGLRGEVDMASVLTNADSLTAKLKNEPGMFEVEKYPTATFIATGIEPATGDASGATHKVHGHFTLRGITKSISFPAKIEVTPEQVVLSAEFAVNRHEFGVSYEGGTAFPDIRDGVLINLDIEAQRPPRPDTDTSSTPSSNDEPTTRSAP